MAEERGFFKKHGLDVEAIFIGGGAARGINALLAGDIQFASASGGPVISSMLKGSEVIMIAALNNKGVHRLLVRPEIDTPEALKGKRIAITAFGTASHTVLTLLLNHWNLRQEELNVLQIGSSPTMLVSLQKKIVDGAVLTDPSYFIAEDNGFRVLADLAKMNIHYLQSMLVSTRGYLRGNRDQATRVMRAYVEGIAYFKRNKKESIRIILKKMRMDADKEKYAERTYDQYANTYFDRVPYPSLSGDAHRARLHRQRFSQSQGRRSGVVQRSEHPQVARRQRLHQEFIRITMARDVRSETFTTQRTARRAAGEEDSE